MRALRPGIPSSATVQDSSADHQKRMTRNEGPGTCASLRPVEVYLKWFLEQKGARAFGEGQWSRSSMFQLVNLVSKNTPACLRAALRL